MASAATEEPPAATALGGEGGSSTGWLLVFSSCSSLLRGFLFPSSRRRALFLISLRYFFVFVSFQLLYFLCSNLTFLASLQWFRVCKFLRLRCALNSEDRFQLEHTNTE